MPELAKDVGLARRIIAKKLRDSKRGSKTANHGAQISTEMFGPAPKNEELQNSGCRLPLSLSNSEGIPMNTLPPGNHPGSAEHGVDPFLSSYCRDMKLSFGGMLN
jgi:hypothetical protein